MTGSYEHVCAFALDHPWAITPNMRAIVADILARRLAGETDHPALLAQRPKPQPAAGGGVAIIPVHGVVAPRMNLLSDMSGGTTFEALTAQLHDAMKNPDVKTIVFDVDSPGGNVAGATEFAHEVLKARTQKPVIAQAQHLAASAAYWCMSCATEVVASPSSMVGSIGVFAIHDDLTDALAKLGVKRQVLSAGKFKADGVGGGPLTDEARARLQHLIDATYDRMLADIASGRGATAAMVRSGYGEGALLTADDAKAAGMVDRIAPLTDTVQRALGPTGSVLYAHALIDQTTAQEPHAVTADRSADVTWHNATLDALLQLDL